MTSPICTECARTALKRTIGAIVFLRLSKNLEDNLDEKLLWATFLHETTEKRKIISKKRRISILHGPGGWRAIGAS